MPRIKMLFGYDGTEFYGYQIQPKGRTVQAEIDRALSDVFQQEIRSTASGRTDRGVHAIHQVAHFDVETNIPVDKMPKVVNARLPEDISVFHTELALEDFHARYDVVEKTYCYTIDNNPYPDILKKRYAYHVAKKLNVSAMRRAANYLIGEHDFTSFCCQKTDVENKVRTIYALNIKKTEKFIQIIVTGNGFLYNMVRIIAGALIEVGKGRFSEQEILRMLEAKDRNHGTATAPANGLTLWNVSYKRDNNETIPKDNT